MTRNRWLTVAMVGCIAGMLSTQTARAAKSKVQKAEDKMMAACKKEYPDAVKGKSFKDVEAWIDTEEKGANKDTFKKSKCYNTHEEWEKVAGHNEPVEAEHK